MRDDVKKVAIIGVGMVGMSCAYAILNQRICDELLLVDIDKKRAAGEAADLNHGLPFAPGVMKIESGNYEDCCDADIVVITAGAPQKDASQTRRELLQDNVKVFRSVVEPVVKGGFSGIFLVATNPVDVMTYVTWKLSGFDPGRVIGSGTSLDSARLKFLMGAYFAVNPKNIHAYVIGEHGDSEFVPWSNAMVSVKPLEDIVSRDGDAVMADMEDIAVQVCNSAYEIIQAKRVTNYGIGMVLARLVQAILSGENSIFSVSAYLDGAYDNHGIYAGVPAVVNAGGVREILEMHLTAEEQEKFNRSCAILRKMVSETEL